MTQGEQLARAATHLLGAPFRLHGRDPRVGLDCVGLLLASLQAIGIQAEYPRGYALRNRSIDRWIAYAPLWSLADASGPILAGDVLISSPGPNQHHVMIAVKPRTVIHAHAGLRRVVREPLKPDQVFNAHWRVPTQ